MLDFLLGDSLSAVLKLFVRVITRLEKLAERRRAFILKLLDRVNLAREEIAKANAELDKAERIASKIRALIEEE